MAGGKTDSSKDSTSNDAETTKVDASKSVTPGKKSAAKVTKTTAPKTTSGTVKAAHPKYSEMVVSAIRSLDAPRTGVSRHSVLKKVKEDFVLGDDEKKVSYWVNVALKKGVDSGMLKMAATEGRKGAGSYKLGEGSKKPAVKAVHDGGAKVVKKTTASAKSKIKASAKRTTTSKAVAKKATKVSDAKTKAKKVSDGKAKVAKAAGIIVVTKKPMKKPSAKKPVAKSTTSNAKKSVVKSSSIKQPAAKPTNAKKPVASGKTVKLTNSKKVKSK